jgi:hypothetical protein
MDPKKMPFRSIYYLNGPACLPPNIEINAWRLMDVQNLRMFFWIIQEFYNLTLVRT